MKPSATSLPRIILPTDEEDAEIRRGIALDPDNPELDDDFFDNAIHISDFADSGAAESFLMRRRELSRIADELGMSREAWDDLRPNKPGFEDRFIRRMEDVTEKVRAVAAG